MDDLVPSEFFLSQNYPNPFSEKTIIKFCVPYRTNVKLQVFNIKGNLIKKLIDEEKEVGTYEIEFSAKDRFTPSGSNLNKEMYFYQLKASTFAETKKMILLRQI